MLIHEDPAAGGLCVMFTVRSLCTQQLSDGDELAVSTLRDVVPCIIVFFLPPVFVGIRFYMYCR